MTAHPSKIVMLVLDGAADSMSYRPTPLEKADTPGLDSLAANALCGLAYTVGPGIAPESDEAVISLLGYRVEEVYTGRGPLEALGAGLDLREDFEVAFRANFATIDEGTLTIVDRRVGRSLTSEEAAELAKSLNGMKLDGGRAYARVKATIGHRAVVIIGSREVKLSDQVDNTDPAYVRKGLHSVAATNYENRIRKCRPLADTPEARYTCKLVDEFTAKAIEVLSNHPVNLQRAAKGLLKANAILLRDAGSKLPRMKPFTSMHPVKRAAALVEMPVERGIAKAAGLKMYEVPLSREPGSHRIWVERTLEALSVNDFVYVHLKGPDEPGHDGDYEAKVKAIEAIDKEYVRPLVERLDLNEVAVIVTSDHATPWRLKAHSDDPVPVMVSWKAIEGGPGAFSEKTCAEQVELGEGLGFMQYGWQILPTVFQTLRLI